ncbi:DUF6915 family protein [Sphingobacterium lactis]|uniref:DUF6915 family protein n=1 Tax=Sphingobacterium TaxID=28453 RepID=UPI0021A6408A|nr:hypothetical protein [Sphingobacterium hotanense]MCT1526086.1 hypothetical protein [Sphingobacterium hotanense]
MHYYDHALLSAKKYNCHVEDTLQLHKIMDSSKHYFPAFQHRIFSHNLWFIQVVTDLIGDVIRNTKTGEMMSVRDILFEHCREDHNGKVPSLADWLQCIRFEPTDEQKEWFNNPRASDKIMLNKIKVEFKKQESNERTTDRSTNSKVL